MKKDINITTIDERRLLVVPGDQTATVNYSVNQIIELANEAISARDQFAIALSGGSTPKAIYQALALPENKSKVDWKRCFIFWSDERAVAPEDPESNFHMAMAAGLSSLGIPTNQIFRMQAEKEIKEHAQNYESVIHQKVKDGVFDLIMLGMGDDGHTASLFPHTDGLKINNRWVIANYVPQKKTWRMTFTYDCINAARHTAIYVTGAGKAEMLKKVLTGSYNPEDLPIQRVGTPTNPALWICDTAAADLVC